MFNQIHEYLKNIGLKKPLLEIGDFKKQSKMAGYLIKASGKSLSVDGKTVKFDIYNITKLKSLGVDAIAPPDMVEVEEEGQILFPEFGKRVK